MKNSRSKVVRTPRPQQGLRHDDSSDSPRSITAEITGTSKGTETNPDNEPRWMPDCYRLVRGKPTSGWGTQERNGASESGSLAPAHAPDIRGITAPWNCDFNPSAEQHLAGISMADRGLGTYVLPLRHDIGADGRPVA